MARFLTLFALTMAIGCNGEDVGADSDSDMVDLIDPDVDNYVPESYPPASPTTAIFFGDSITAGVGAGDTLSWSELLVQNNDTTWGGYEAHDLQDAFPSITRTVNVAKGGDTTGDLLTQAAAAEAELTFPVSGPVFIGVTIGGNDLVSVILQPSAQPQTVAAMNTNIGAFIDWTQDTSKFPDGAYVYMANVYDPSDGVGTAAACFQGFDTSSAVAALQQANDNLRTMAETRGFSVVDMHGHFAGHGLNYTMTDIDTYDATDPSLWFESDCIHPNQRGHHELRRIFFAAAVDEELPTVGP
ncbi:MAG: SGNH/GDSL hydrolase family protein [Proteobacteria bacterium]|nr:SGNH/GDSL hydrolase family protein [Pseudomonadota bacterium]